MMQLFSLLVCLHILSHTLSEVHFNDEKKTPRVHCFYYLWYGTPEQDSAWKHWDHEVLPHWEDRINERFKETVGTRHDPPGRLHSPFYPQLGPYSSKDSTVIAAHFDMMQEAGINIAVVSWWGQQTNPESTDTQGVSTDRILGEVLKILDERGSDVKVAFHLEPYPGRTVVSIKQDLEYIYQTYGHHKCIYRTTSSDNGGFLFYVYDSYHISNVEWARLLKPDGDISIRNTAHDGIFFGLWLNQYDGRDLVLGGFDGVYSYFASLGFSHGSSSQNWREMCRYSKANNMDCSISVGPGYDDVGIRPWNFHNKKNRLDGKYYDRMWNLAITSGASVVSITSWNEWGEGTQIEPAAPSQEVLVYIEQRFQSTATRSAIKFYEEYPSGDPFYFTNKTLHFATEFNAFIDRGRKIDERMIMPITDAPESSEVTGGLKDVKIRNNNGILEYL